MVKPTYRVLLWLLVLTGWTAKAENPPASPNAKEAAAHRVNVRFITDKAGTILLDEKSIGTVEGLRTSKSAIKNGGVEISLGEDGQSVFIAGKGGEVVVEAERFAGWAAKVPDNNQLGYWPKMSGELELAAPAGNKAPITMRFSDGGAAELTPDSLGHLDVFLDKSYYFTAFGKVNVNNADGEAFALSNVRPPLTGGPLGQSTDAKGVNRYKRLTPLVEVRFGAGMDKEVAIEVGTKEEGGQLLKLARDEKRRVSLKNGTIIDFWIDAKTHMVDWHVEKGLVRFSIDGFECWRALGLTGQHAGQQWNSSDQAVDLTNFTTNGVPKPNHNLYTSLSKSDSASVSPQAMMQYSPVNPCQTYHVSSVGQVVLYNSETREAMSLNNQNLLVKPGASFAGSGRAIGSNRALSLSWDAGTPLDISGVLGDTSVPRNSEKSLIRIGGEDKVDVRLTQTGELTLTAIHGDYLIQPKALDNWGIELHEGDVLTLNLDSRRGVFTLRTGQENPTNVKISTADGFQPIMSPDTVLTFIIGRPGTTFGSGDVAMTFYEPAGSGGTGGQFGSAPPATGPTTPFLTPIAPGSGSGGIDVTRLDYLDQPPAGSPPPVSVVGP